MTRPLSDADLVALNALLDGELDAAQADAMQRRLAAEPELAAAHETLRATREAVTLLPLPEVSPDFARRMAALGEPVLPAVAAPPKPGRNWVAGWQNIAATILVTALVASGTTYLLVPRGASLESLVAASHRRSLLAASPLDVVSSDRHTVKPWLDARLGVSPPAPDLAAAGYPLLGGRVDVLGQEAVPTLVYRHNEHTITLVAVPGSPAAVPPHAVAADGYNMLEWSAAGFSFTAASDLEAGELQAFATAYRQAAGP